MKLLCFFAISLVFATNSASAACNTALPSTTSHFLDKGDGTVVDGQAKLMWKKCLEGLSGTTCSTGTVLTFDWAGALSLSGTSFATYSDWRLPNIKELQSIVEEQCDNPAINATVFPNVPAASQAWSSSPYSESVVSGSTTYWKAWAVYFTNGAVSLPLSRSTNTLHVRLVRDCTGTECD
ncbi:MAG: Lcl C-terminal domain-containing protein [Candidatus Electronema sp. V4]|uniref:Lcl C-terminal domain-containing protein n=1 Tax=Candidatus Electronema sp. V4 TaxID=3454756 RepID=UPI0040557A80